MLDRIENNIAMAYELFDLGQEAAAKRAMIAISHTARLYGDSAIMQIVERHLAWFAAQWVTRLTEKLNTLFHFYFPRRLGMRDNFIHFLNELEVFFLFTYPRYQQELSDAKYLKKRKRENIKRYEAVRRVKMRHGNSSLDESSQRYHGLGIID
jgi:hypothetical protein